MAPLPELNRRSPRAAEVQRPGELIDQAHAAIARSQTLMATQAEALSHLQASRARHSVLRATAPGAPFPATEHPAADTPLTRRQLEILRHLADGLTTRQIAEREWLSRATVRNHVSGIFVALDCHSRLEAVAEARRRHLV
jgi:DNA-binding NarL/FixJ family response regulator